MINPKYKLCWVTEDVADEEWLSGEQISHTYYCNNKTELMKRYRQAAAGEAYNFEVYVWNWNQYCLTNMKLEKGEK